MKDESTYETLTIAQLELSRNHYGFKRDKWLRDKGWEHTSSTPGCYWMWLREWNGKTLMVGTETAERIQGEWDKEEYFMAHPEDAED